MNLYQKLMQIFRRPPVVTAFLTHRMLLMRRAIRFIKACWNRNNYGDLEYNGLPLGADYSRLKVLAGELEDRLSGLSVEDITSGRVPNEGSLEGLIKELRSLVSVVRTDEAGLNSELASLNRQLADQTDCDQILSLRRILASIQSYVESIQSPFSHIKQIELEVDILSAALVCAHVSRGLIEIYNLRDSVQRLSAEERGFEKETVKRLRIVLRDCLLTLISNTKVLGRITERTMALDIGPRYQDLIDIENEKNKHFIEEVFEISNWLFELENKCVRRHLNQLFRSVKKEIENLPKAGGLLYALLTVSALIYIGTLSLVHKLWLTLLLSITDIKTLPLVGFVYGFPTLVTLLLGSVYFVWVNYRLHKLSNSIMKPLPDKIINEFGMQSLRKFLHQRSAVRFWFRENTLRSVGMLSILVGVLVVPVVLGIFAPSVKASIAISGDKTVGLVTPLLQTSDYEWYQDDSNPGSYFRVRREMITCLETISNSNKEGVIEKTGQENKCKHSDPPGQEHFEGKVLTVFENNNYMADHGRLTLWPTPYMEEFRSCVQNSNDAPVAAVFFDINESKKAASYWLNTFGVASKTEVKGNDSEWLNPIVEILKGMGTDKPGVFLAAFASNSGSSQRNLQLAKERALFMKEKLTDFDVRYVFFGDAWSSAFPIYDAKPEVKDGENPEARSVLIYVCSNQPREKPTLIRIEDLEQKLSMPTVTVAR